MNKAELLVNGKSLIFTDKSIIFDGHELFYENISNIAHRGGDHPAMIFNYNGKRLALPYHPKDRNIVIKMFRDIIEEKRPLHHLLPPLLLIIFLPQQHRKHSHPQ